MKKFLSTICILKVLFICNLVQAQFDSQGKWIDSTIREDLDEKIRSLDPVGDKNIKKGKKLKEAFGGYRTELGVHFKKSCVKKIGKKNIENLYENFRLAAQKMLNCRQRYPELSRYVDEWINRFRRIQVNCSSKGKSKDNTVGTNSGLQINITKESWESLSDKSTDFFDEQVIDTIIHEILHSTSANSNKTFRHNNLKEDSDEVLRCSFDSDHYIEDRVYLISNLCSRSDNAHLKMYEKIKKCGDLNVCAKVFTGKKSK